MNPTGKGGFGEHKEHINRNGTKLRDFAMFRAAAIKIANEEVEVGKNKEKMPIYEAILRQWAQSKNPQLQMAFIAYAFGKVPDRSEITGADGGSLRINIVERKPDV